MAGEIMTVEETAEFLGFSPYTIRDLARRGEIPATKVGREWRFLRSALFEWLRSRGNQTHPARRPKRLRIRPAPKGSGRLDVSVAHDRYFARP